MFPNETIALIRDCQCEKGCQHKIVHVTLEYIMPKEELNDFLEDFNQS